MVGVDGSEAARAALRWALVEARTRGAQLQVVHAWNVPFFGPRPSPEVVQDRDDLEAGARIDLEHAVADIDLTDLTVPAELLLVNRPPATALLEAAEAADLLVVGTRGRGGFAGLLLGSVSQQLAQHAPCPVVIVPHHG